MTWIVAMRYEVVRELAKGAMGSVYEALDRETDARVALKLVRHDVASDPSLRQRLRREASILRVLAHPAIVRILDAGEGGEGAFTVMELLVGETLEARLARSGALPLEEASRILLVLASALEAAHGHGIVHGDVKPANVFLTDQAPGVKLVDFGLSKVDGLDRLTRTGELAGTPIYMAPELFDGTAFEGDDVDARLDLYALGVLAYQSLSGASPFDARKHPGQLLFEIARGKFTPLAERAPQLPHAICAAVEHAMRADRRERPASASELLREWTRAFEGATQP